MHKTQHRSQVKKQRNEDNRETRPRSSAKYIRLSDTKARIVLDKIKGKDVTEARALLAYSPRYASSVCLKILNSAIANADHNSGIDAKELFVEDVRADQGPTLKRMKPRARGSADRIEKKTCHITIILNKIDNKEV